MVVIMIMGYGIVEIVVEVLCVGVFDLFMKLLID